VSAALAERRRSWLPTRTEALALTQTHRGPIASATSATAEMETQLKTGARHSTNCARTAPAVPANLPSCTQDLSILNNMVLLRSTSSQCCGEIGIVRMIGEELAARKRAAAPQGAASNRWAR